MSPGDVLPFGGTQYIRPEYLPYIVPAWPSEPDRDLYAARARMSKRRWARISNPKRPRARIRWHGKEARKSTLIGRE